MVELNPSQQEMLDRLGRQGAESPEFGPELRLGLRQELTDGLAPIATRLSDPLWLNKHVVAAVLGCEARLMGERDQKFSWSVPTARGSVAHKAIELSVHRHDRLEPMELVDEAISSLIHNDPGLGDWLATCGDTARAEIRSEAVARVAAFTEIWPPLSPRWNPVLESRLSAEFADGMIMLRGKTDLTLGRARGEHAGKVIVDMKTGRYSPEHVADLRFYALLETLKIGTPPRMLATSYLDSGELHAEAVTADLLWSQVRRVIDAAGRYATLIAGERDASTHPGPACRWCGVATDCADGQAFLRGLDEDY